MKRTLPALAGYILFAFVVCLVVSVALGNVPAVLDGQKTPYLFFRGLQYFLKLLPALLCSAMLVVLSIYFGKHTGSANERFSPAIIGHFKQVMVSSLCMVFVLAMSAEIFLPAIHARQNLAEQAPRLLNEYLISGRYCMVIKNYYLAHEYGRQALKLAPNNREAQALIDDSERSLHTMQGSPVTKKKVEQAEPEIMPELREETVTSLLEKARTAYAAEKWFDAHYYAQLALAAGDEKDINLKDARRLAAEAWAMLDKSTPLTDFEAKKLYDKKRAAYAYLISGDTLEAYYEFMDLASQYPAAASDPDVAEFFEIAKERLSQECFFIDETLHLQLFEGSQDVYFTSTHADGAKDVIFIRGITTVSNSGKMIQYLRDFSLYAYSPEGTLVRSIVTPYAKMVAEPVEGFGESAYSFGLQPSFKNVPYIILKSVSRDSVRMANAPVYTYADSVPEEERVTPTTLVLAMPFDDFNLVCDAAVGPRNMNLLSLIKIANKAHLFGYPDEVYGAMLISRLTYPLLMLILFIFCAAVAWNYRIKKNQVFKFVWIFAVPLCVVVLYMVLEVVLYVSEMLCYALVGFSGDLSLIVAVLLYVALLVLVSVLFLARKSSQ